MEVAEQRLLPTAEAVKRHWYRQRHIDADHAHFDAIGKAPGGFTIAGEQAGAVAVLMGIDQRDGVFEARYPHHAEHRAKDLVAVDAHLRRYPVEQAGTQEIAWRGCHQRMLAAIHQQFGARRYALLEIAGDLVAVAGVDQRAHVQAMLGARADSQLASLAGELLDQRIGGGIAHAHRHRDRHAALTGTAEGGADQGIGGVVEVGVGQHHGVVLGTAQRLDALALLGATAIDGPGHRGGADERQRAHLGGIDQGLYCFPITVDDVEDPRRQAGLLEQLGHLDRRRRHLLGGLEDKGVATGNSHGIHPQRHHGREVERRDASNDTQRLVVRPGIDLRPGIVGVLALEQLRHAAGVVDVLDAALELAHGVFRHLAVLFADQSADRLCIAFEQHLEAEHDLGALGRRRVAPGRVGGTRGVDGSGNQRRVPQAQTANGGPAGGIGHVDESLAGERFAADMVGYNGQFSSHETVNPD